MHITFTPVAATLRAHSFTPTASTTALQSGKSSISGSSSDSSFFSTALDVITFIPRKIWGLIQMLLCCGKSFKDQIESDPKATAKEWIQRVEKEGAKPLSEAMRLVMDEHKIDIGKLEVFLYQLFLQSGGISEEGVRNAVIGNIETWHKWVTKDEIDSPKLAKKCLLGMAYELIEYAKSDQYVTLNESLDLTLVETMDLEDLDPYFTNILRKANQKTVCRLAISQKVGRLDNVGFNDWAKKFNDN